MGSASVITRVCCEAVRSAILATAWLLVMLLSGFSSKWLQLYQCLHGMAPAYVTELCTPVTSSASRHSSWRSSVRHNQQLGRTTLQTVSLVQSAGML